MADPIPLTVPLVGAAEAAAVAEVIESGWLAQGPRTAAFEKAFAKKVGAKAAVAVSNGTAAIELALRSVGVGGGDVVVTVSHSFIATANAIRTCGAQPLFVDIERKTLNMSPQRLSELIESEFEDCPEADGASLRMTSKAASRRKLDGQPRLAAILVVHQVGLPANMTELLKVANTVGTPIVEDAACALGSRWKSKSGEWQPIGGPIGAAATFSFHPRKVITTGEGGMVTFSDDDHFERARLLRNHGLSLDDDGERRYLEAGFNLRMSDVAAAIGLVQLGKLDDIVSRRRDLAASYRSSLQSVRLDKLIVMPTEPAWAQTNWQTLIVGLTDEVSKTSDEIIDALGQRGIAAQPGIMCAHLEPAYRNQWQTPLLESERARRRGITLPLFPQMTLAQVERVVSALKAALL